MTYDEFLRAKVTLGHSKATTTDIYIRQRGLKVRPNK